MTPDRDFVKKLERIYPGPRHSLSCSPKRIREAMTYGTIPPKIADYIEKNPEKKVSIELLNDAFRLMEDVDLNNQGRFTNSILKILRTEEKYAAILSSLCKEDIRKSGSIKITKIKDRLNSPQMKNVHFIN
jgi:hypothetical protein